MALNIDFSNSEIKVISSKDEAVTCTQDDYDNYLKNLDETILGLKPGIKPTRFVLRKQLNYGQQQQIKSQQMTVEKGKIGFNVGYMMEEIRLALTNIEEETTEGEAVSMNRLMFKRSSDGGADHDLIAKLESAGIVSELFTARNNYIKPVKVQEATKKN